MAREEKRFQLKPVDDAVTPDETPVIRLQSDEPVLRVKPAHRISPDTETNPSHRLDVPSRDAAELRTHQPGIEALIEQETADPDAMEQDWGAEASRHRSIPWGWFALIGLLIGGAIIWSLGRIQESTEVVREEREATELALLTEEQEEAEAAALIGRIEGAIADFFNATSVEEMIAHVRHPERVAPLMRSYYRENPPVPNGYAKTRMLQPLTLENMASFWMAGITLADGESRNVIIETTADGAKLDWETLVAHQPMDWDEFATKRPEGTSMDFRVYVERDNFFSHEFADSDQWISLRLTALDADETLFGYTKAGSETAMEILDLLNAQQGRATSMILRLHVPEGIQSRRGVVIEDMLSPRWLYVRPPGE